MKKWINKLFRSKNHRKKQPISKPPYDGRLSLLFVYKDFNDTQEELEKWLKDGQDEEFWEYPSIGETGPMGYDQAKDKYRIPIPISYTYPVIFVYDFSGSSNSYLDPLYYSTDKKEIKRFIEEYEESFAQSLKQHMT
ncbi:hypothetical protein ACTNEO_10865 [Gracilibacillus sp. HCP3S3_G5_1]|uniref:hypothetical protein n=1 Tax=unclassified Gracilibacillus TaxID=2625209 RepID=UPI003F8AC9C4